MMVKRSEYLRFFFFFVNPKSLPLLKSCPPAFILARVILNYPTAYEQWKWLLACVVSASVLLWLVYAIKCKHLRYLQFNDRGSLLHCYSTHLETDKQFRKSDHDHNKLRKMRRQTTFDVIHRHYIVTGTNSQWCPLFIYFCRDHCS